MMKKRRYGALLVSLLCICMVMPLSVLAVDGEASAAGGVEALFELSYPSELPAVGETFEVTVSLKNNPGFGAIQFEICADNDNVKFVDSSPGSLLSGTLGAANVDGQTNAIIAAASFEPVINDGELAAVECVVLEKGEFSFAVKNVVLSNVYGEALPFLIENSPYEPAGSHHSASPSVPSVDTPDQDQSGKNPEDRPMYQPGGSPADTTGGKSSADSQDETTPVRYTDVTEAHWACDYVYRATEAGLFNGFPDGSFHPDEHVTRAQFITVLWRMSHSPAPEASVQFTDTPSGEYYYDAVRWGVEKGYINGVENPDGTFAYLPDATITREQVMTILFRFDGEKSGMESLFTTTYDNQFTDSGEISDYARKAMYWAYYKTYISGTSSKTLSPKGLATRAQISKILVEYQSGNDA